MIELLKSAGPFAFLNIAVGAAGALLAVAALATGKSNAGKVLGVLALVIALIALSVGFGGYFLGMTGTHRALGNVPDDMRDLLLRKGTEESRGNLIIALGACLLPLLAGLLSTVRNAFRPGIVLGAIAVLVAAMTGLQLAKPLPPEGPPYVEPAGITLAPSNSPRGLRGAALIGLMPDGLWANGSKVSSLEEALAVPLVKERNANTLPVMVDAKVKFAALADLVAAAEKTGRNSLQLVVLSPSGAHQVISVYAHEETQQSAKYGKPLTLTVRVTEKEFLIGAIGGSLDPLPADPKQLNDKLAEVKASFPDVDTIRVGAGPEITFGELVKTLDAVVTRDGRLLFPEVLVGNWEIPKPTPEPTEQIGTKGGPGYGTGK